MRITVLGAGSWGTTLAILLSSNAHEVILWAHREDHARVPRLPERDGGEKLSRPAEDKEHRRRRISHPGGELQHERINHEPENAQREDGQRESYHLEQHAEGGAPLG